MSTRIAELVRTIYKYSSLFFWVEALHPSLQYVSPVGTFSGVEPVLCNEDDFCIRIQRHGKQGDQILK